MPQPVLSNRFKVIWNDFGLRDKNPDAAVTKRASFHTQGAADAFAAAVSANGFSVTEQYWQGTAPNEWRQQCAWENGVRTQGWYVPLH